MLTTGKISTVMSLLCLTSSVYSSQDQPPSLTEEDLRRIATLNLCPRFGGACGASCQRYIVHRWRLPLCADSSAKCCIPDSAYQGARVNTETTTIQTTTTSTTTTTTALPPSNDNLERQEPTAWMTYPNSDNTLSNGNTPQDSVNTQISLPSLDECGQMNWPRRQKRIVGGSVSPPGSWPWLTALRSMFGAHTCSGALISQRWVVTAAHCFKQFALPTMWRMRVGEYDLLSADDTERDLSIANIFIYPGYMSRAATESNSTLYARYKHDLALVQLAEDARVEPICLPSGEVTEAEVQNSSDDSNLASRFRMNSLERNGECWVAGWGFTRDNNHVGQILRQVQDDVVDSEECGDMWNTPLERDVICFGNGTRGPCSGDSGGPLSCWLNNRWYLAGVVSWGTEDCNRGGYPSVFTRVSPYLNWLHGIIRQQERLQRQ